MWEEKTNTFLQGLIKMREIPKTHTVRGGREGKLTGTWKANKPTFEKPGPSLQMYNEPGKEGNGGAGEKGKGGGRGTITRNWR